MIKEAIPMNEKQCAEEILRFIKETACFYGSDNLGEANEARKKITAIRAGNDEGLDWHELEAENVIPWSNDELKGVKTAIAADLKFKEYPEMRGAPLKNFDDFKRAAKLCIQYATGRCAELATVGVIRGGELAPHISIVTAHFFKKGGALEEAHALLLVGLDVVNEKFVPNKNAFFCDPWKDKRGPIVEYPSHLKSLGFSRQEIQDGIFSNWQADSVSPTNCVTPTWLSEREETLNRIEATYQKFLARNIILNARSVPHQSVSRLRELLGTHKIMGFWQSRRGEGVVGARILCGTKENKAVLESELKKLNVLFKFEKDFPTNLIVDDINGSGNGEKIDTAYRLS